jgi:hypothetical protein
MIAATYGVSLPNISFSIVSEACLSYGAMMHADKRQYAGGVSQL